jgi:hypothetical protein
MRLLSITALLLSTSHLITSASIPLSANTDLITRDTSTDLLAPSPQLDALTSTPLSKRKGGGGGRSSGGGGGGSSRSGGSTSSGGRSYSYSSSSNSGGRTRSGSGISPNRAGYYPGGAKVPFASGGRSPSRGIAPIFLPIAFFGFFPGLWLYGSLYSYPYGYPYYYRNATGRNQTVDVECLCQQYSVCGCDDDGNSTYLQDLVGNGTDRPVNTSSVVVLPVLANGTQRAYVNGSLENGTTAAGGTEPSSDADVPAGRAIRMVEGFFRYWVIGLLVLGMVVFL